MFVTRVRTQRRSFATAWPIAKLKPALCSVESKLPIGVKIPFSTKCGEWVIYAELVTIIVTLYLSLLNHCNPYFIQSACTCMNIRVQNACVYICVDIEHSCWNSLQQ